jgi:hypothetical protein
MGEQWKDRTGEWSSGPMGVIAFYSGPVFGQRWKVQANKKKVTDSEHVHQPCRPFHLPTYIAYNPTPLAHLIAYPVRPL